MCVRERETIPQRSHRVVSGGETDGPDVCDGGVFAPVVDQGGAVDPEVRSAARGMKFITLILYIYL